MILTLDQMHNLSIDEIVNLYIIGYRLEDGPRLTSLVDPTVDPVVNFGKVTVTALYSSTDTSIGINDGSRLPDPSVSGDFNLIWWNSSDYPDPSDDPNREIVRCTANSSNTLTVTRGQEGITASNKNTTGKIYKMTLSMTAKTISDIQTDAQNKVNTHAAVTSSVHNFDSSGNAPPQAHGSAAHTGTIGTTSQVTEGTNLYFTNARAQAAISNSAPITYSGGVIGITQAASGANGYLSSTDWNTFNNKQGALGYTPVNKAGDTMSGSLTVNAQYASTKYAGSTGTINWNNGNVQSVTLASGANSFTSFSNGISGGRYMLLLTEGTSSTVSWPASVKWPGGTAPTLTPTAGKIDIVTFIYDGTNYYGNASFNY